jgi:hypothetical protein
MASRTREDAALLVSIAWWETGRTFDLHPVGDHGHSVSPFQLWCSIGSFEQALLAANLDLAAMEALKRARESVRACRALAPEDRLSIYTSGRCRPNREAKIRWQTSRWLLKVVPEWQDVDDIT